MTIQQALNHIEAETCLRFSKKENPSHDYIHFKQGQSYVSHLHQLLQNMFNMLRRSNLSKKPIAWGLQASDTQCYVWSNNFTFATKIKLFKRLVVATLTYDVKAGPWIQKLREYGKLLRWRQDPKNKTVISVIKRRKLHNWHVWQAHPNVCLPACRPSPLLCLSSSLAFLCL